MEPGRRCEPSPRSAEVAKEARPTDVGPLQRCTTETSAAEVRPVQIGFRQVRAFEVGTGEVDPGQTGPAQCYGIANFLVVENFVDGGGPVARSVLSTVGTSQAFGALPYPGQIGMGYPGYAAVATGRAAPPYPFYAGASYPTQVDQEVKDPSGVYVLTAKASENQAAGSARMASASNDWAAGSISTTEITNEAGKVTAVATSQSRRVTVGPLSIALARSESVTTYEPGDDTAKTASSLKIEGGRVGDVTFTYDGTGLKVAQHGVPVPARDGLGSINSALDPAGLAIRFGETDPTPGGQQAVVFEVVSMRDIPGAGPGTMVLRSGRAVSSIELGSSSSSDDEASGSSSHEMASVTASDARPDRPERVIPPPARSGLVGIVPAGACPTQA